MRLKQHLFSYLQFPDLLIDVQVHTVLQLPIFPNFHSKTLEHIIGRVVVIQRLSSVYKSLLR